MYVARLYNSTTRIIRTYVSLGCFLHMSFTQLSATNDLSWYLLYFVCMILIYVSAVLLVLNNRCKNISSMSMRRSPPRCWPAPSGPPQTSGCTGGGSPRCWQVSGGQIILDLFFCPRDETFFVLRSALISARVFWHVLLLRYVTLR